MTAFAAIALAGVLVTRAASAQNASIQPAADLLSDDASALGQNLEIKNTTRVERGLLLGIKGVDDRVRVDSAFRPWSAIGRVNRTTGGFCTGVMIAPNKVLTAAHCLWNKRTERWMQPHSLHFLAGYQRGQALRGARVVDYAVNGGTVGEDGKRHMQLPADWAVLTLDEDIGRLAGIMELAPFDRLRLMAYRRNGAAFLHAGYSQDKSHVLTMHAGCQITGFRLGEALALHDCDATHGDSGSPILVKDGDRYRVVGLHVATVVHEGEVRGIAISSSSILSAMSDLRGREDLAELRPVTDGARR
ncbi:MAG: trypsin-like serine peptidase [Alphaproteobacteria bacterium]